MQALLEGCVLFLFRKKRSSSRMFYLVQSRLNCLCLMLTLYYVYATVAGGIAKFTDHIQDS